MSRVTRSQSAPARVALSEDVRARIEVASSRSRREVVRPLLGPLVGFALLALGSTWGCGSLHAASESGGPSPEGGATATGGSSGDPLGSGGDAAGGNATGGAPPAGGGANADDAPRGIADDVTVTVSGRRILVNGEPLHLRGVCWNPVGKGGSHPADLDFARFASLDLPVMRAAGINAVRTYEPITDRAVLDELQRAGIFLLNTVYANGEASVSSTAEIVGALADHPAILMWVLGNEWNYNHLYSSLTFEQSVARLNEVAAAIRLADPSRPVATIYGELPPADLIEQMPDIDVWGINAYRNIGFGSLFDDWRALSGKPMFLGEYGADAWNANEGRYDPESQAHATTVLTQLIVDHSAALGDGVVSGGTLFEWADEWWKAGNPDVQDDGAPDGVPGGGPYPDDNFDEEWWGIVDIERTPRPAYDALAAIYTKLGPTPGTVPTK